jgi:hypothetical protein
MNGSGGLPIRYSVTVWRGQADYRPNIQWLYDRVRRITYRIFSDCMEGSGGLPTTYYFGVWTDRADYRQNIQCLHDRARRITDQIFIRCMQGSWLGNISSWPDTERIEKCRLGFMSSGLLESRAVCFGTKLYQLVKQRYERFCAL